MQAIRCKSCGGEYQPETPNGLSYFHACPPLICVHVERGGIEQDINLADLKGADVVTVQRDGARVKIGAHEMRDGDVRLGDTLVERPNKRDENVQVVTYDKAGNAITAPKADGAGVERLAP